MGRATWSDKDHEQHVIWGGCSGGIGGILGNDLGDGCSKVLNANENGSGRRSL